MNQPKSIIPVLSGLFSSLGLAPHLFFLLFLFFGKREAPLGFLIPTYLASILLGEYLFYKRVAQNISSLDWLKRALHPLTPGYFLWAYVSEILLDSIFLFLAIKFGWNPLNFFLLLLGCKFFAAPVQVYLSPLLPIEKRRIYIGCSYSNAMPFYRAKSRTFLICSYPQGNTM